MVKGIVSARDRVAIWHKVADEPHAEWEQQLLAHPEPQPEAPQPPQGAAQKPAPNSNKFKTPANGLKKALEPLHSPKDWEAGGGQPNSHPLIKDWANNIQPGFSKTYFKPEYQDALKSHLGDENYEKLKYHMPKEHHDALHNHEQAASPKSNKFTTPANGLKKLLDQPHTETSHVSDWLVKHPGFQKTYMSPKYQDALKGHLGDKAYNELQEHLKAAQQPAQGAKTKGQEIGESLQKHLDPAGMKLKNFDQFMDDHGGESKKPTKKWVGEGPEPGKDQDEINQVKQHQDSDIHPAAHDLGEVLGLKPGGSWHGKSDAETKKALQNWAQNFEGTNPEKAEQIKKVLDKHWPINPDGGLAPEDDPWHTPDQDEIDQIKGQQPEKSFGHAVQEAFPEQNIPDYQVENYNNKTPEEQKKLVQNTINSKPEMWDKLNKLHNDFFGEDAYNPHEAKNNLIDQKLHAPGNYPDNDYEYNDWVHSLDNDDLKYYQDHPNDAQGAFDEHMADMGYGDEDYDDPEDYEDEDYEIENPDPDDDSELDDDPHGQFNPQDFHNDWLKAFPQHIYLSEHVGPVEAKDELAAMIDEPEEDALGDPEAYGPGEYDEHYDKWMQNKLKAQQLYDKYFGNDTNDSQPTQQGGHPNLIPALSDIFGNNDDFFLNAWKSKSPEQLKKDITELATTGKLNGAPTTASVQEKWKKVYEQLYGDNQSEEREPQTLGQKMQAINPNISAQVFDKQSPEGQKDILQNFWAKEPKWGPEFQKLYNEHYGDVDEINNIKQQQGNDTYSGTSIDDFLQWADKFDNKTPADQQQSIAQGIKAIFPNTPLNLDQMSEPELKQALEGFIEHLADTPGHADNMAKLKALYDQHFGDGDIEAIKSQMPGQQQTKSGPDLSAEMANSGGLSFLTDEFQGKSFAEQMALLKNKIDTPGQLGTQNKPLAEELYNKYNKYYQQIQQETKQKEIPQSHIDHAQILDAYGEPSEDFMQWFSKTNDYPWGEKPADDKGLLSMLANPENPWTKGKVKEYLKDQENSGYVNPFSGEEMVNGADWGDKKQPYNSDPLMADLKKIFPDALSFGDMGKHDADTDKVALQSMANGWKADFGGGMGDKLQDLHDKYFGDGDIDAIKQQMPQGDNSKITPQLVLQKLMEAPNSDWEDHTDQFEGKSPEQLKADLQSLVKNDPKGHHEAQWVLDQLWGDDKDFAQKPGSFDLQDNGVPTAKQLEAWGVDPTSSIFIADQSPEKFENNLNTVKSKPQEFQSSQWKHIHDALKDHDWPLQSGNPSSGGGPDNFDAQKFADEFGAIHDIPGENVESMSHGPVKNLTYEQAKEDLQNNIEYVFSDEKNEAHKKLYDKYFGDGQSSESTPNDIPTVSWMKEHYPTAQNLHNSDKIKKWWDANGHKSQAGEYWNSNHFGDKDKHLGINSEPSGPPEFDPHAFAEQYKEILPGSSSSLASGTVTPEKAQEKLKSLIEGNPGTAKTTKLQELHDQWFGAGSAPGGGTTTPAKKAPATPVGSPHYKALMKQVMDKAPAGAFSEADLKKFRSKKFKDWFDKAPTAYQKTLKTNPGIVIDDFDAGSYSAPVGGGEWENSDSGQGKYYDMMGYPKTKGNEKLPKYLQQIPPRSQDVKFPQYADEQETLPLPPGEHFAPHYGPLPIYRVLPLDLDRKNDPENAPHHLKTNKERSLWAQQQNARLHKIDTILNGDSPTRSPGGDLAKLKNWGSQYKLTDEEINDVAGMLYGQQGDLFADDKWNPIKELSAKHPEIDISEFQDLAKKLEITPSEKQKGNYDHPELGKLILDYMENNKHRSDDGDGVKSQGGLGWHWTRAVNKMYKGIPDAGIDKSDMKGNNRKIPVAISGLWTGQGEGGSGSSGSGHGGTYAPDHPGEKEHNLRTHAPVHIRRLQIRAPGPENQGYGEWHDTIDHGPMSMWTPGRYEEGDEFNRSDYAPGDRVGYKPSLAEELTKATGDSHDAEIFDKLKPGHKADMLLGKIWKDNPTKRKKIEELYRDFFVGRPDLPTKPHERRASLERVKRSPIQARKRPHIVSQMERVR